MCVKLHVLTERVCASCSPDRVCGMLHDRMTTCAAASRGCWTNGPLAGLAFFEHLQRLSLTQLNKLQHLHWWPMLMLQALGAMWGGRECARVAEPWLMERSGGLSDESWVADPLRTRWGSRGLPNC